MKMTKRTYRRIMRKQKLYALAMLAVCAIALWICSTGRTMADRDCTAVVVIAPFALYLLFTKKICIYY